MIASVICQPANLRSCRFGGGSLVTGHRAGPNVFMTREAAILLGIATDEDSLIRHVTLDPADRLECELRRRPQNKLGFAVQLCTMRQTGRLLWDNEQPPAASLPAPIAANESASGRGSGQPPTACPKMYADRAGYLRRVLSQRRRAIARPPRPIFSMECSEGRSAFRFRNSAMTAVAIGNP